MATAEAAGIKDTQPGPGLLVCRLPAAFWVPTKSSLRWEPVAWAKFISRATSGWDEM